MIEAEEVKRRVMVASMRALGHRWWSEGPVVQSQRPAAEITDLESMVESEIARFGFTSERVTMALGKSLREWLEKDLLDFHTTVFKKRPVLHVERGRKGGSISFRHAWRAAPSYERR
jgi:hypothetical protein